MKQDKQEQLIDTPVSILEHENGDIEISQLLNGCYDDSTTIFITKKQAKWVSNMLIRLTTPISDNNG